VKLGQIYNDGAHEGTPSAYLGNSWHVCFLNLISLLFFRRGTRQNSPQSHRFPRLFVSCRKRHLSCHMTDMTFFYGDKSYTLHLVADLAQVFQRLRDQSSQFRISKKNNTSQKTKMTMENQPYVQYSLFKIR